MGFVFIMLEDAVFWLMYVWWLIGTYQFKTPESSPSGTPIGRIKASDADVGENAEIEYSITEGEGLDMFDVITDQETQEGIITVKKVMLCVKYHTNDHIYFPQVPEYLGAITSHMNIPLDFSSTDYIF